MPRSRALQSSRYRNIRRRRSAWLAAAAALAVASLCTALVLLLNASFLRIATVTVSSADATTSAEVRGVIIGTLQGSYLGIVPKDSTILFPGRSLARSIPAEFPQILEVSFSRTGMTGVSADVVLRTPYTIVCAGSGVSDCYYTDASGILYAPATATASSTFMVYHMDLQKGADPLGMAFLDSVRLSDLSYFAAGLSRIGFLPESVSVAATTTEYEFTLEDLGEAGSSATSTESTTLIVDESRPLAETLQDFSAFWQEHLDLVASGTEKRGLSFVDMRYGDNIVYKVR